MRAVIAPHLTDLTRYTGNGPDRHRSEEATVSIIGRLEDLRQIEEIDYADYHVCLDHAQQRARHRHHHDPAIPFKLGNEDVLQVFLYGLKPDPEVLEVGLRMKDGRHFALKGEIHPQQEVKFLSRMSGVDDWTMVVETATPLDLIIQSKVGTQEKETQRLLPPGRHELEVHPWFCERYALCLSPADDPFGSLEVKHSFIGEVGASSGRFLWSKNKLWLPPTRTLPSYISLIVDCITMTMNDAIAEVLRTADEVDVISSLANVAQVQSALSGFPSLRSRITIAEEGFDERVDIALVEPADDIPSDWTGKTSCLLFNDQANPMFRSRLKDTLFRLEHDRKLSEKALESLWTTAEENHQPEGRTAAYGIAWSTSSQTEQKGKVSLLRTMAMETDEVKADIRRYAAQPFNADVYKRFSEKD
ncbi:hypothetical protein [Rhizobium sp. MHM7A]|uniref:hypothetical protein n=1 Tax=Rhizobium sp. MHM7A TaxID=2583233 RepID=UPI001105DCE8|nr:hypothetical protein [Rhizobium sp. MHM7A]TLX17252.1 hypothetical protein FFR93_08115 [Rhizobium sp. MHM7A]